MTKEKALEMGGKEWQGKRVYFNSDDQKAALYGVTIQGKDGYIDGEKISRSNLYKITVSKPYFDVATEELCGTIPSFSICSPYASPKLIF